MAKTRNCFSQEYLVFINELIGYVESPDSNEIWPEHSLSI